MSTKSGIRIGLDKVRARLGQASGAHQSTTIAVVVVLIGVLLPQISAIPGIRGFGTQADFVGGFADAGVFVLLAIGLNVVVGFAGLLDLGYAAFFAIGAYSYAYGASNFSGVHLPFWFLLPIGALVAALFGILLGAPTLRLRGDYLAIVTLGFGEIVPVVFLNSDTYTNGTNGITALAQPNFYGLFGINSFGFTNPWPYWGTILVLIAITTMLLYRIQDSRLGRAWVAIREDELAAASMGIDTVTTKLLAFAIGASIAGLAGVYFASKLSLVNPDLFGFTVSFTILAMVVLGGMGNIWGVAIGAFIIYELQAQGLKQLNNFVDGLSIPPMSLGPVHLDIAQINFLNLQYLLYGLALVGMMQLRPEGLFPSRRRRQELHQAIDADALEADIETLSER
jgi:ABC-type branched-subunit amino acid transport system permease subunit